MSSLEVIGAGLGRTGTLSLQSALKTLGFDPCHHMLVVLKEQTPVNCFWSKVAEGDLAALQEIYQGYKATVDYPGCRGKRGIKERLSFKNPCNSGEGMRVNFVIYYDQYINKQHTSSAICVSLLSQKFS